MTEGGAPGTPPAEHLDTTAVRAGREPAGSSLATPLWATSTFSYRSADEGARRSTAPRESRLYSRHGNPTVSAFEEAVADLEGAQAAQAFASGMGAITTLVLALCSQGDHVVAQRQLYSATYAFLAGVLPRFGVEVTFVDAVSAEEFAAAVRPGKTTLLLCETPTNPLLEVVDLEAVGAIKGPVKVCDSTFGGPFVQRPLDHGFDAVVHSATKSLSGHNDATAGVLAGPADLIQWVWSFHTMLGAVASPFDALNALRGIRTLAIRTQRQSDNAQRLAEALDGHPAIAAVHYPGLDAHPQRDVAKRQMTTGGGMVSFDLAGGLDAGRRFVEALRLARMANSLGGPDTLVSHTATSTAAGLSPEDRASMGIGDGLIRVSVGLEHPDDLIADFQQALSVLA